MVAATDFEAVGGADGAREIIPQTWGRTVAEKKT